MKRLILFSTFFILFLSCGNNARQEAENRAKAEAARAEKEKIEKEEQERIAKRKAEKERQEWEDSMALFAWEDVKFGMTEKEVRRTKTLGNKKYNSALKESLGLYNLIIVTPEYDGKNRGLSSIRVYVDASWDYLDELASDIKKICRKIESKYGKPTGVELYPYTISESDLMTTRWKDVAYWNIGSPDGKYGIKCINTSIHKSSIGSGYTEFLISIHNPNFNKDYKPKPQSESPKTKKKDETQSIPKYLLRPQ